MVFWTWAKSLEDQFDGANRRNLRHFISKVMTPRSPGSPSGFKGPATPRSEDEMSIPVARTMSASTAANNLNYISEANKINTDKTEKTDLEEEEAEDIQLFLDTGDEKIALPRMETMAIFHKLSSGKGVPHTFYGFLRQWPALPRVVVCPFSHSF